MELEEIDVLKGEKIQSEIHDIQQLLNQIAQQCGLNDLQRKWKSLQSEWVEKYDLDCHPQELEVDLEDETINEPEERDDE